MASATDTPGEAGASIPADLAAASYAIYSQLLPGNEIEWGDARRNFWLLREFTSAEPAGNSCATSGAMNPHLAIQPPEARKKDFAEVLADFDARCHAQYRLDASQLHVKLPVHVLTAAEQSRYEHEVSGFMPPKDSIMQAPPTPKEFVGAAGLHSFSAVFFNRDHMLAMTEIGMYCGGLCGNWRWVVLEWKDGHWKELPWVTMASYS